MVIFVLLLIGHGVCFEKVFCIHLLVGRIAIQILVYTSKILTFTFLIRLKKQQMQKKDAYIKKL